MTSRSQLYRFGHTVSIPFFTENWEPTSWFDKMLVNYENNMHTLCLLDIKVKEPDYETLMKTGRETFLPPRYMSIGVALSQFSQVASRVKPGFSPSFVGCARLGHPDQSLCFGTLR